MLPAEEAKNVCCLTNADRRQNATTVYRKCPPCDNEVTAQLCRRNFWKLAREFALV